MLFASWWLVVVAVLVGYQTSLAVWPGPGGVRVVTPLVQLVMLSLFLSVPVVEGFAAGWFCREWAGSDAGIGSAFGWGLLAGLIALVALVVAFVVLDGAIESALGYPTSLIDLSLYFELLFFGLMSVVAGALLGAIGGIVGGLIAAPRRAAGGSADPA
jgi:hypothetical protein